MDGRIIELEQLLHLLKANGVSKFSGHGVSVEFGTPEPEMVELNADALSSFFSDSLPTSVTSPKSIYDDPRLWQDGQKPTFGDSDDK